MVAEITSPEETASMVKSVRSQYAEKGFLRFLSLGAGIQSTTLALMSLRGDLPPLDAAAFADTQAEPSGVYKHLGWLKERFAEAGVPLFILTVGDLRADAIAFRQNRFNVQASTGRKGYASIPLFILNPDNSIGRVRRQCTNEYKIQPIEKFIKRDLLGIPMGARSPKKWLVEQWFGITTDEARRAKPPSGPKVADKSGVMRPTPIWWRTNTYPLMGIQKYWEMSDGGIFGEPKPMPMQTPWIPKVGMEPLSMTRQDCIAWLHKHYPGLNTPRSACLECPYRSDEEWQHMKENDPEGFEIACQSDDAFRIANSEGIEAGKILAGVPFVHRSMKPLREVDFTKKTPIVPIIEYDENGIFAGHAAETECEGMCGL